MLSLILGDLQQEIGDMIVAFFSGSVGIVLIRILSPGLIREGILQISLCFAPLDVHASLLLEKSYPEETIYPLSKNIDRGRSLFNNFFLERQFASRVEVIRKNVDEIFAWKMLSGSKGSE
jgi:hypothetical protein